MAKPRTKRAQLARVLGRRSSAKHDPSRRLGAKVFSYFTEAEKALVERAAQQARLSVSSYVAKCTLEAADRELAIGKK